MSISITAQSHLHQHPGVWLGAKLALALVAILLLSLTAAGLETRYGVAPSADSATSWVRARSERTVGHGWPGCWSIPRERVHRPPARRQ